jgi:hypothetical protein
VAAAEVTRLTAAVQVATEETETVRGKLHNAIRKGKAIDTERAHGVARIAALEEQLQAGGVAVADAAQLKTLKQRVARLEEELQVQCGRSPQRRAASRPPREELLLGATIPLEGKCDFSGWLTYCARTQAAKEVGAVAQEAAAAAVEAAEARFSALAAAATKEKRALQAELTREASKAVEAAKETAHQLAAASAQERHSTAQAEAAAEALDGVLQAKAALQAELKVARLAASATQEELRAARAGDDTAYGDEKVANRDVRVWHGATEKGP